MKRIKVNTQSPYEVTVGENILSTLGKECKSAGLKGKAFMLTDTGVPSVWVKEAQRALKEEGFETLCYAIPNGEQSKNKDSLFEVLGKMADFNLTRGNFAVAVGGGVVGDLLGFAAAIYMRGIKYAQVPTTLLAAIDSSVGGKTAVDLPQGKNLVGAFHQPTLVLCDVKTLSTLSEEDIRCGVGEAVKYGLLQGGELWEILKTGTYDKATGLTFENTAGGLVDLVCECVKIKADVVSKDEREGGLRKILNLGLSVGHAIEKLACFTLTHGVCVAKGLVKLIGCMDSFELAKEVEGVFARYGIDCSSSFTADELVDAMRADKKSGGEYISLVGVSEPGKPYIKDVPFSSLGELLCRW